MFARRKADWAIRLKSVWGVAVSYTHLPLLVELKADYFDVRELVKKAVAVLDRCQVDYCIESFHPGVIFWLKRHRPDICRQRTNNGCYHNLIYQLLQ